MKLHALTFACIAALAAGCSRPAPIQEAARLRKLPSGAVVQPPPPHPVGMAPGSAPGAVQPRPPGGMPGAPP